MVMLYAINHIYVVAKSHFSNEVRRKYSFETKYSRNLSNSPLFHHCSILSCRKTESRDIIFSVFHSKNNKHILFYTDKYEQLIITRSTDHKKLLDWLTDKGGIGDPIILSFIDLCSLPLVLNAFKLFKIIVKSQEIISHGTPMSYTEDLNF